MDFMFYEPQYKVGMIIIINLMNIILGELFIMITMFNKKGKHRFRSLK